MAKDDDTLQEARDDYASCIEGWGEVDNQAIEDLRFARLSEQWPVEIQNQRKIEGRPALTINRLPSFIRQVVNDGRQNRPSIKVHPVDSGADPSTADVMGGLIRHVENISDADIAYDTGLDCACSMGKGFIGVETEYACDDSFDLECKIVAYPNPLMVTYDPMSQAADSSDWRYAFVSDLMPKDDFEAKYPGLATGASDFAKNSDYDPWYAEDSVRVAKYYKRVESKKTIVLLSDGSVVDKDIYEKPDVKPLFDALMITVVRERETPSYLIYERLITGDDIIEEKKWKGSIIPIAPVYGDSINVQGKRYFNSLIHDAKDSQRMFNYSRTTATELVSLAPKVPWVGEEGVFDVDLEKWQSINTKTWPFVTYKKGGQAPERLPFGGIPEGPMSEAAAALEDMKQIIGISNPSLGMPDNQVISGVAKRMERYESDTSTFHFIDNQHRAIRCIGRILLERIPQVYTGPRIARVIGADRKSKPVALMPSPQQAPGQPQAKPQPPEGFKEAFDLTIGKYDLVVEAGPSYATRREEAAENINEYLKSAPQAAAILGPMLARLSDWPEADKVSKLLETVMPPEARAVLNDQPPPPPSDPPEVMAKKAEAQAELQMSQQKAQQEFQLEQQRASHKAQIEATQAQADMAVQQQKAQLDAEVTRQKAQLEAEIARDKATLEMQLEMQREKHRSEMELERYRDYPKAAE